ncbi:hypothetical protein [Brevundimonas intermedia]|uniref:hypothetical protein n=1 Tax=Brevundimonas intermedia TaxID=74315 RepID=UPI003209C89C
MGKLERITAEVPVEMANGIRAAVGAGAYASTDALVLDALGHWLDGARPAELASEDLRTLIAEGAEGEGMDVDVFFDRLDQEIGALHHPSAKVE